MAKSSTKRKSGENPRRSQQNPNQQRFFIWIGVAIAALIAVVIGVFIWQRTEIPFKFVDGDERVLVLLRNTYEGEYQLEYTGEEPVQILRLVPMIQGQLLYVDVEDVVIQNNDNEITLEVGGRVPAGETFLLQPGENLGIRITYLGQELGGNYLFGFRLGYEIDGAETESDFEIDQDLTIIVE